jgi:hypothetical protein
MAKPIPRRILILLGATLCGAAIGALSAVYFRKAGSVTPFHIPWLSFDESLRGHLQFLVASVLAWALFSCYWEAAAKSAAAAKSSESQRRAGFMSRW